MKKFVLMFVLALVGAGVVAISAEALSFRQGDPCQDVGTFVCPSGNVGKHYSIQLIADGGNGPPYTFVLKAGAPPSGITLSSSGQISGTPTVAGTSIFGIELQDKGETPGCPGCGCVVRHTCAYRDFKINVNPGLAINQNSVAQATIGLAYSQTLTATQVTALNPPTGPQVNATWSVKSGTLPPGITLSPVGVLAGTPTTEGSYQFVVEAVNGETSDAETYTVAVRQPVVIAGFAKAPKSEVGVPFDQALQATGGTGTFTWALAGGALPTGVTFDATIGTISGTPTVSGSFPFSISVTDSEGRIATLQATIPVAAKLSIKTLKLRAAKVGKLYNAKLATLGGVTPLKWKILRGTLPRGVHFAKKLGMFTGTPKREGTYRVTVQAIDGFGIKTQKTFVLVVKA